MTHRLVYTALRRVSVSLSTHGHQGVADQGPPQWPGRITEQTHLRAPYPFPSQLCGEQGKPTDPSFPQGSHSLSQALVEVGVLLSQVPHDAHDVRRE